MNGARFVHDSLEFAGWEVLIADAQRVRGLAPLAAKTDKIDARVLAELTRRALVPEVWLPTPEVRAERERARFRPISSGIGPPSRTGSTRSSLHSGIPAR
jgi:transposase